GQDLEAPAGGLSGRRGPGYSRGLIIDHGTVAEGINRVVLVRDDATVLAPLPGRNVGWTGPGERVAPGVPAGAREAWGGFVNGVHRDDALLEVVGALHAVGGLPNFLHGGEQQADQDGDDGNDDQELDERKSPAQRRPRVRRGWKHNDPLGTERKN